MEYEFVIVVKNSQFVWIIFNINEGSRLLISTRELFYEFLYQYAPLSTDLPA